ncbi:hypothetical protein D3C80_2192680 [compost metagenome]
MVPVKLGAAMASRIARIATVTISSTRVKPSRLGQLFMSIALQGTGAEPGAVCGSA